MYGLRLQIKFFRRLPDFSQRINDSGHEVLQYCKYKAPKFDYQEISLTLTVNGKMEEREYRDLLSLYPGQANVHAEIKRLYTESQLYLSDDDLSALETYESGSVEKCFSPGHGYCVKGRVIIYCLGILRSCWGTL